MSVRFEVIVKDFHTPVRFIAAGILNTIVGYGTYAIALGVFGVPYMISLGIAQVIGIIHSFIWHKYWTFRSKNRAMPEFTRFVLIYAVCFFLNYPLLNLFVEKLHTGPYLGQGVALILLAGVSFIGHRNWSFKEKLDTDRLDRSDSQTQTQNRDEV